MVDNRNKRVMKLLEFMDKIENEIFDYEKIKDLSIDDKLEFYKNAKNSLVMYVNIMKEINNYTSDDEMLKNIILSLSVEQKNVLKKMLLELIKKE